ncbi:phage holin family protein [Clostridium ganghwense]|uniref:Phage holin family protein n=1 Tax=Clostridium ganghwense TaxID=312089 RepID=A0ABT4CUE5_9CLOT|nr:phage holin family protein [Clostridium ganghwense]MCY6372680.1 phage holin family protein [Clostridium ganghwense]
MDDKNTERSTSGVFGYIVRFALVAIILAITSFLTPGFNIVGIWPIVLAAVVITIIDYLVERVMGVDASPFGKGIKGFVIAALIIYVTQFIVPNMTVSIVGAVLASIVIGILDAVIPGRAM